MNEFNTPPDATGITSELESFVQYEQATGGQRFVNWLIDNLLTNFAINYLSQYILVFLLQALAPSFLLRIAYDENRTDAFIVLYLTFIFSYLLYYTICEKAFRGYTLGKLVSGSRAIRADGAELTFKDALLRSLSRIVPFEVLSGFGTPWHDSWTKTTVIKTR